ncbi:transketolase [Candidatus Campbellbacteria bacterium CG11_big_fil_rev_8_21_14_0_20_44_21]|nr:MAG: transketolase [Candidatus Campbellbacteria bacterium CG11_big_fil_rev_8_21_14_0_20_44_21]
MLNESQKLNPKIFDNDVEKAYTRDGYGKGVVELGEKDERIVVLCADLAESTRSHWFQEKFPERYIEIGVAEQNLATVASGMAVYGKIPFISSYATFSPGRNNEQIRTTISINNVPVKIMGAHSGISVGPDGATHQALEDMALMRVQPNMTVIAPCDMEETKKAVIASVDIPGPVYIRFGRAKTPVITTDDSLFEIGKANLLWSPLTDSGQASEKPQVAIISCGPLTHNALLAAKELEEEGLKVLVLNNHTIKPMDEKAVVDVAKRAGRVVTVEEHQVNGGMGSAVAEVLAKNYPVPIEFIGVKDSFGQSGKPEELIKHYGMDKDSIKKAVKRVLDR